MKTIGLIGGMSWASTALYYRLINQEVMNRLGGLRSARVLLASLDFAEVVAGQKAGEWDRLASLLGDSARRLERAGADIVLIATNTMHKVADAVQAQLSVPLLHIGDVTADAIRAHDCRRVALLGTRYTMELPFYAERLRDKFGLDVLVPDEAARNDVHRIIYDELCHGVIDAASRATYVAIIDELAKRGAQAVILGCTEITLLIGADDSPLPVFDTTALHAKAAVEWAAG
jgi:aspartate racemase